MRISRHGAASSWFSHVTSLTTIILLAVTKTVLSINVSLPDEFDQCMPALVNLSQIKGNVTILIREQGVKKPLVNISLPTNATSYNWTAVDIAAGENFTILVTDSYSKRKAKYFTEMIVDPSPTNDSSCLPVSTKKKHHKGSTGDSSADDGSGDDPDDGLDLGHSSNHHTIKTTEVSVIAGVLGGLLFALLSLILIMCWRRRRESKNHTGDDGSKDTITAHRIGEMGERLDRHRVITLFSEDGRAEGQAILGREGDAGWSYMSRLAPGLQLDNQTYPDDNANHQRQSSRRRGPKTRRYDNESKDGELPSYGLSEYEKRTLPKYADDGALISSGAMVLTTRRDSQGSRLTFSPEAADSNGIAPTPRQSTREPPSSPGNDDEEVIVFRPQSNRSLLPYQRNYEALDRGSVYSNASHVPSLNPQASTTSVEAHSTSGLTGHRRSRSEISLRRNNLDISPFR